MFFLLGMAVVAAAETDGQSTVFQLGMDSHRKRNGSTWPKANYHSVLMTRSWKV